MIYDGKRKPISNLIGRRFGMLVVTEYVGYEFKNIKGYQCAKHFWKCKCDCGNEKITFTGNLTGDHAKSCGCTKKGIDLTGNRYGRLVVINEAEPRKRKDKSGQKRYWFCKCDCGNTCEVRQEMLVSGHTKSCGCIVKEGRGKDPEAVTNKYARLYKIYRGMKDRCTNPNDQHHTNYYDKGVKMCDEWLNNPKAFIEWSLNNKYEDHLTIDRIDPFGNYEPSNCRWITNKEQQRNKRNTIRYNVDGEMLTLAEIAERYNIKVSTLSARVYRYGYTIEEAINAPVKLGGKINRRNLAPLPESDS